MEQIPLHSLVRIYVELKDIARPSAKIKQCTAKLEEAIHNTIMSVKQTGLMT